MRLSVHKLAVPSVFVAIMIAIAAPATALADDVWHGRLLCPALPGVTDLPMNIEFEVTQAGTSLSYNREIRGSAGGNSGGVENGTGTIVGTHVDIVGKFAQRGASEAVHYAGEISGGQMHLTGEQVWTIQRTNQTYTRPCRANLRK